MDLTFYRKNGYQVVPGLLDGTVVAEVRSFLESEMEKVRLVLCGVGVHGAVANLAGAIDSVVASKEFPALDKQARDTLSGNFLQETRLSPRLWPIPRQAALQALLRQALETETLYMHMLPSARFVFPGNRHAGVPAHRDTSYNGHLSDFLTVWVPFVEIDRVCGGVQVFEGSMADAPPAGTLPAALPNQLWFEGVPTEGYRPVETQLSPGDVLLLHKHLVHRSLPNRSNRARFSIDFRFFGSRATTSKHYLDMQQWCVLAPGTGDRHEKV